MIEPLLTFVVLSYNYGRYLPACLESILAQQDVQDFEVIVVDDASTDDSCALAATFSDQDTRVRLVANKRNQGHGATVTTGLKAARGEFIARIDCDDRYRPHFAREALAIFAREPSVGLVHGDAALINHAGAITQASCDRMHRGQDFKGNRLAQLLERNFICSPTVMARRNVWLDALPIPRDLAFHDWYFTLMAARRCDFYYTHQVVAEYRVHTANLHKSIVRDRTEEPSIFRLLDTIFHETESSVELESQKQRAKRRVYGVQNLTLADKYFGLGMSADARRCYLHAMLWRPAYALRVDVLRRLSATFVARTTYDRLKSLAVGRVGH
jgi:glycosyltransferase involved in cell wall biosynthesis